MQSAPTVERISTLAPPREDGAPTCSLTIDVEDWYQSCVDFDAPISERVVRNVDRVLEVLDEHRARATFFVQGRVAEAFPSLVRAIAAQGHEVQSHAHTHRPLDSMSPAALREEIVRGREAVENAAGVAVTAFRAPDFSIGPDNFWALETLAEAGFRIDSSIFPMRLRRYGVARWELAPHRLLLPSGATLVEAPVAVLGLGAARLPVAGGGYFRLLPYPVLRGALDGIVASRRPVVIYCHPYEFNPTELDDYRHLVVGRRRITQGLGRRAFVGRLRRLLTELSVARLDQLLAAWGAL